MSSSPSTLKVRFEATGPPSARLAFTPELGDESGWNDKTLPFSKEIVVEPGEVISISGQGEGVVLSIYIEDRLVKQDPTGTMVEILADAEAPSLVKVRVEATGPSEAQLSFSPDLGLDKQWQKYNLPFTKEVAVERDAMVAIYGQEEGAVLSVYVEDELVKKDPTGTSAAVSLAVHLAD